MFSRLLLSITFILSSAFVYATPQQLLKDIHSMRLDSTNAVTNYYMFSGLAADSKYEQRIFKTIERFDKALESVEEQSSDHGINTSVKELSENWQNFKDLMAKNRSDIKEKGYPEFSLVIEMAELSNTIVDQLSSSYLELQQSSEITSNKKIEKTRDLELLIGRITNEYSLRASINLANFYAGISDPAVLAESFRKQLDSLVAEVKTPKTEDLLNNIQKKWDFIESPISNFNENTVVFLVVSYNDRIVEHLHELEELL